MALQYTDPENPQDESAVVVADQRDRVVWEDTFKEWHYQRINICLQLCLLYRKMRQSRKGQQLTESVLARSQKSRLWGEVCQSPESMVESLYLQLSEIALELRNLVVAATYASRLVDLIVNQEKTRQVHPGLAKRKAQIKAHGYFLLGKTADSRFAEVGSQQQDSALKNFRTAFQLAHESWGPQHARTLKYKERYLEESRRMNFNRSIQNQISQEALLPLSQFREEMERIRQNEHIESSISSLRSKIDTDREKVVPPEKPQKPELEPRQKSVHFQREPPRERQAPEKQTLQQSGSSSASALVGISRQSLSAFKHQQRL